MQAFKKGKIHFLRLDRGEDIVPLVTSYCEEAGLRSAMLSGIGAIEEIEIGFYDLKAREYLRRRLDGIFELLSLTGNITKSQGKAFMHAHAVLSSREFDLVGGHFFGGKVAVTCEIFLAESGMLLSRKMNEEIGLRLVAGEGR